jgi:hypothetical protein
MAAHAAEAGCRCAAAAALRSSSIRAAGQPGAPQPQPHAAAPARQLAASFRAGRGAAAASRRAPAARAGRGRVVAIVAPVIEQGEQARTPPPPDAGRSATYGQPGRVRTAAWARRPPLAGR